MLLARSCALAPIAFKSNQRNIDRRLTPIRQVFPQPIEQLCRQRERWRRRTRQGRLLRSTTLLHRRVSLAGVRLAPGWLHNAVETGERRSQSRRGSPDRRCKAGGAGYFLHQDEERRNNHESHKIDQYGERASFEQAKHFSAPSP